jgi:hypothetical protein
VSFLWKQESRLFSDGDEDSLAPIVQWVTPSAPGGSWFRKQRRWRVTNGARPAISRHSSSACAGFDLPAFQEGWMKAHEADCLGVRCVPPDRKKQEWLAGKGGEKFVKT